MSSIDATVTIDTDQIAAIIQAASIIASLLSVFFAARWAVLMPQRNKVNREILEKLVFPIYLEITSDKSVDLQMAEIQKIVKLNALLCDESITRSLRFAISQDSKESIAVFYRNVIYIYIQLAKKLSMPLHFPLDSGSDIYVLYDEIKSMSLGKSIANCLGIFFWLTFLICFIPTTIAKGSYLQGSFTVSAICAALVAAVFFKHDFDRLKKTKPRSKI